MRLLSNKQMQNVDKLTLDYCNIDSLTLMQQAAQAIYNQLIKDIKKSDHIIIACGNGNNGGDGFALACLLVNSNYNVEILFISEERKLSKDALSNYNKCKDLNIKFNKEMHKCDVLIDAIFGTGLNRNIEGKYYDLINSLIKYNCLKISIDIPSGLDANDGKVLGICFKSDITYTLASGKIGLYLDNARDYTGVIKCLDIGIPSKLIDENSDDISLIEKDEMKVLLPTRKIKSNKGTYGKVLCVGGSATMSGAICLAGLSALKSGCGLLTLAIPKSINEIVATNILEATRILLDDQNGFISKSCTNQLKNELERFNTILVGCGIGRNSDNVLILKTILDSKKNIVIDADALVAFKSLIKDYRGEAIITPHLKEFADLMNLEMSELLGNELYYAKEFSKTYPNITLVLKSATTIIIKDQKIMINNYGNNGLSKGGSGDVLAGIITGLYAQNNNAFNAVTLGVFLHAYSADKLLEKQSIYSIIPSEVLYNVDNVIKELTSD